VSSGTRISVVRTEPPPGSRTENPRAEKLRADKSQTDKSQSGKLQNNKSENSGKVPAGSAAATVSGKTNSAAKALPQKTAFAPASGSRPHASSPANQPMSNSSPVQEPFFDKLLKNSTENAVSTRVQFMQMARALSLPTDTLSITLLAVFHFFSLSPGKELLSALRREILGSSRTSSSAASSPTTAREKAALEMNAFAAAAAMDKGVVLSPEALERYADFFGLPDLADEGETEQKRKDAPTADELESIAEQEAKKDGLLNLLNSIPGKNGQYWTIIPFNIEKRGTVLRVLLRILKGEPFLSGENGQIIADITGPKRQYRCFLKKTAGKFRADIRVYPGIHPPLSPRALKSLSKKAERFLGIGKESAGSYRGFDEILVQNGEEEPSWVEGWCAGSLPSIDKEV